MNDNDFYVYYINQSNMLAKNYKNDIYWFDKFLKAISTSVFCQTMQDFDFIGPLICEQKVKMIYLLYLLFAMHVKFSLNFNLTK